MPKPSRIFLVRHGESQGNVDRAIHATVPDWKIELTARGRDQAYQAGRTLSEELPRTTEVRRTHTLGVYTSPYRRTLDTWVSMRGALCPETIDVSFVKEDLRLREQEWGALRAYEPRRWADIEAERDAYGSLFWRFPQGESGCDVADRLSTFLDTLHRDFEKPDFPDNVLIVTHGYTLRVLLMRWLHWSVERFHVLKNPANASIWELRRGPDGRYALVGDFPVHPAPLYSA